MLLPISQFHRIGIASKNPLIRPMNDRSGCLLVAGEPIEKVFDLFVPEIAVYGCRGVRKRLRGFAKCISPCPHGDLLPGRVVCGELFVVNLKKFLNGAGALVTPFPNFRRRWEPTLCEQKGNGDGFLHFRRPGTDR